LFQQFDSVEQFENDRGAFVIHAQIALEADEAADAEGELAGVDSLGAGVLGDDAERLELFDELYLDAAAAGEVL
jgi:hypothetical protein